MTAIEASPWPFEDPTNCAVIASRRIFRENEAVLSVEHDDEYGWCFWDGSDFTEEEAIVVGLSTVMKRDPSLLALANLPPGWRAWRPSASENWQLIQSAENAGDEGSIAGE